MIKYHTYFFIIFIGVTLGISLGVFEKNFLPLYLSITYIVITLSKYLIGKYNYIFFLIQSTLIICVIFELFFLYTYMQSEKHMQMNKLLKKEIQSESYNMQDSLLGYRFTPNIDGVNSKLFVGEEIVYDVYYSSDKYGRRISEGNENILKEDMHTHAIFLGGSYTFGEGLPYTSTIPYLFENNSVDTVAYNYGFRGYGPHQSVLLFPEHANLINHISVPEKEGYLIYTYMDDHLNRVFGGSRYLGYGSETFDIEVRDDELHISPRNPFHLIGAKILRESTTLKYFNISINYPKTDAYYKRFANIINYTYREYISLFPQGKFYIAIFPDREKTKRDIEWLRFINSNIKIINVPLPDDFSSNIHNYIIHEKYERHPNINLNTYFVEYIKNQIE